MQQRSKLRSTVMLATEAIPAVVAGKLAPITSLAFASQAARGLAPAANARASVERFV